jgi:hypothetical protein
MVRGRDGRCASRRSTARHRKKPVNEMTHDAPGWTDWLEDVLAGLLINGVRLGDIKIKHYPGRTVITVHGIPKYEWKSSAPPRKKTPSPKPRRMPGAA